MSKITSNKFNFIFTVFLVVMIFFYQYKDGLFPFSSFITLDLAEKGRLATVNFFRLSSTQYTHETYYPRLFLVPFFVLYILFDLKIGVIQYLMFFTMILA